MKNSTISAERIAIIRESALRQLQSGRELETVISNLAMKGLTPEEAKDLAETAYEQYRLEQEFGQDKLIENEEDISGEYDSYVFNSCYGGLAGAIAGALIWGVIVLLTGRSFNIIAILVGYLAGYGTYKYSDKGNRFESKTKVIAALCCLVGIALGEIMVFAVLVHVEQVPITFDTYFHGSSEINFMRFLWILIAIFAAVFHMPRILGNEKRIL